MQNCALTPNVSSFNNCGAPVKNFGGDDELLLGIIGILIIVTITVLLSLIVWKQRRDQGKSCLSLHEYFVQKRLRRGSSEDWEYGSDLLHFPRNTSTQAKLPQHLMEQVDEKTNFIAVEQQVNATDSNVLDNPLGKYQSLDATTASPGTGRDIMSMIQEEQ